MTAKWNGECRYSLSENHCVSKPLCGFTAANRVSFLQKRIICQAVALWQFVHFRYDPTVLCLSCSSPLYWPFRRCFLFKETAVCICETDNVRRKWILYGGKRKKFKYKLRNIDWINISVVSSDVLTTDSHCSARSYSVYVLAILSTFPVLSDPVLFYDTCIPVSLCSGTDIFAVVLATLAAGSSPGLQI